MRLSINELLEDQTSEQCFRVLWLDSGNQYCYLIDIANEEALPFERNVQDLMDDIVMERFVKVKADPFLQSILREVSGNHQERRDKAWETIRLMVSQEPDIYEKEKRGRLVRTMMGKFGVTKKTLYKYLRKYWQRGKTPNALLPDYHKSGGRGMEKRAGDVKRGRRSVYGTDGINVDEGIKKIFRVALEKYYLTTKKNNLTDAYKMMIKEFFADDVYLDENRDMRIIIADPDNLPTIRQFRYWHKKEYSIATTVISREGRKRYEKDHRAVLGSSTFEALGPGSRFQIDATVVNVYLISRYNPNWIIGRPVLYLIVDVFSRMVVGMYIGLEGPSWMGAMMALANAAADKVDFCARYGIKIQKMMWPCEHLPEVLLGDRGELEGYNVERLIEAFALHVENAAPYRADLKGIVEKKFDTTQAKVKPMLPGYVEKDFQERGARDYRLDAKLTLEQFTQIMIKQIILHNTQQYLTTYERDEEMIRDEVEPIPLKLWNWGIENRSGKLRYFPDDLIRLHLLPQDTATVTHKGIKFKQMMYSCDRALKEEWFVQARQRGAWKINVSYDPRNISVVHLLDETTGSFELCHLLEYQERRFENKTLEEVQYLIAYEKHMRANHEHGQLEAEVNFISDVESIVREAEKGAKKRKDSTLSKSQRVKSIKDNRRKEREVLRKEQAFDLVPKADKPAEIIPFVQKEDDELKELSIKDFLRRKRERTDHES